MNKTKNSPINLILLSLMAVLVIPGFAILNTGCSTVAPGNDPVVVRAEQTQQIAFDTVDTLLKFEYQNRTLLPKESKQVSDTLRRDFPLANQTLKNAIRAYKSNRSRDKKADLTTALAAVETLLADAQRWQAKYSPPLKSSSNPMALILLGLGLVQSVTEWIKKTRETAKRNHELTPEEEAIIDAREREVYKLPHWQIDP